ncbi:MAG: TetR family transcriptional regulator [candidate division Zixibacteria bacterium]
MPQPGAKASPQRRNRQFHKRQDAILKAASRIIARDGFEGATIRGVAARARINLSGIYYYFENKEELLYALQHHAFSTLADTLRQRLEEISSPEEKLKAVIENHFEFFVSNMDNLKVCVHEIESLSGKYYNEILKLRRKYFGLVKGVISEITSGSKHDVDLTALCLFGSLNWVYMWYDPKKNSDIKKLSSQYLKIFLNGIKS